MQQYQLFKDGKFYAIYASRDAAKKAALKLSGKIHISRIDGSSKKEILVAH